jgi:S1-C subfamily serine protease
MFGSPLYLCPCCRTPTAVDSASRPGTFVCRVCRRRFDEKPASYRSTGHIGFFAGTIVSATFFCVVLLLIRPEGPTGEGATMQQALPAAPAWTEAVSRPEGHEQAEAPLLEPARGRQNATVHHENGLAPMATAAQPGSAPDEPQQRGLSSREVYETMHLSVVTVVSLGADLQRRSLGSGFFVSDDGLICTNLHVVEGSVFVEIISPEGWTTRCLGFVAADPDTDLAILKIERNTAELDLAVDFPAIGARAFAMGNPEGFRNTISEGVVSGRRQLISLSGDAVCQVIQTTAAVSHGSSGGPLISDEGKVVGVVTSVWNSGQSLNFAVPAMYVQALLEREKATRDFQLLPKLLKNRLLE